MARKRHDSSSSSSDSDSGSAESSSDSDHEDRHTKKSKIKKHSKNKITKKEKKHKKSRNSDNSDTDESHLRPVKRKVQSKVQKAKSGSAGNKNDRRRNRSTSESSPEKRKSRNRHDSDSRANRNSRHRGSSMSPSLSRQKDVQDDLSGVRNIASRGSKDDGRNQKDKSSVGSRSAEKDSFDARNYRQKSPVRTGRRSPVRRDERRLQIRQDDRDRRTDEREFRNRDERLGRNIFQEDGDGQESLPSRNDQRVLSPDRDYGRDARGDQRRKGPKAEDTRDRGSRNDLNSRSRQSPDRRPGGGDRRRRLSDSRDGDDSAAPQRGGNRDRSPKSDSRDKRASPTRIDRRAKNFDNRHSKHQHSSRSPDRHGDRRSHEKAEVSPGKKKKSDRSKSPRQRSNSKDLLSPKKSMEADNQEGAKRSDRDSKKEKDSESKKDKKAKKGDSSSDSSPEKPRRKGGETEEVTKDSDKSRSKDKSKNKKKKSNEMKFRSKRQRSSSLSSMESEGSKKLSRNRQALSEERKTKKVKLSTLDRSSSAAKHDMKRDFSEERDPMEDFVNAKSKENKKAKSLTPVPISKLNKSSKSKSRTPEISKSQLEAQTVSPARKQFQKVSPKRKNVVRNIPKSRSPSPHERSATGMSDLNVSKSSDASFGRGSELNRSSDASFGRRSELNRSSDVSVGQKHNMSGFESEADSGPESGELTDSDAEEKARHKQTMRSLVSMPQTEPVSDTEDIETTLPPSLEQRTKTGPVDEATEDDVHEAEPRKQREAGLNDREDEERQKRFDDEFWAKKRRAQAGDDGREAKRRKEDEGTLRNRGLERSKDEPVGGKRADRSRREERETKRKRKIRDNTPTKKLPNPVKPEPASKKSRAAVDSGVTALTGRTGGAYIPPAKLRAMQANITDKTSVAYQRISWEALKKSINGLVNKVNVSNIIDIVKEMFQENIVRGRGLMARSIIQAQSMSPTFSHVYAALVAIINTKFPQNGELILRRLVIQFRRGFKRNDKSLCLSTTRFIGHLVNQQVAHEVVALEILTLLLETPSDDAVEVAIGFLKESGQKLTEVTPRGVNAIFERLRNILHEGQVDTRVEYMIEVMFAIRKDGFKDHPSVLGELDLVIDDDQFTHLLTLEDAGVPDDLLNIFRPDPDFAENEEKYKVLKKEILDEGSSDSDDDSAGDSGSGSDDSDDEAANEEAKQMIIDSTETNLVALRRTIYLTIQSSLDFEECAHKLMKMDLKPGQEVELCNMVLDCCAQMRTYEKFYGLLAQRFCMIDRKFIEPFQRMFVEQYETIHRLETNKLRNVAKFFGHLLHTDAITWQVLNCIRLNEEDTSSASRIFIKILFQELSEYMGLPNLNDRLKDPTLQECFMGLLPRENPRDTRFAINFFTTVGLGGLTDDLREHLKSVSKKLMQQKEEPVVKSDSDSSESSASSSDGSNDSSDDSSDSNSSDSDSSEDDKRKKKKKHVETKKKDKEKKGKDKRDKRDVKLPESPERRDKTKRKGDKYSEKEDSHKGDRHRNNDSRGKNEKSEKGGRRREDGNEERQEKIADRKKNKDYSNGAVEKSSKKKDKKKNKGDVNDEKKTTVKLLKMANYDPSDIEIAARLESRDRSGKVGRKDKGGGREDRDQERFEARGDADRPVGRARKGKRGRNRVPADDGGDRARSDRDLYDPEPGREHLPSPLEREVGPYARHLGRGEYLENPRRPLPPPPRYRDERPPLLDERDPRVDRRFEYLDLYEDPRRDELYDIEREREFLERELLYQRELDEYDRRERLRRNPRYVDSYVSAAEYDHPLPPPPRSPPLPLSPVKGLSPRTRSDLNRHGEVIVPLPPGGGRRTDDFAQLDEVQDNYFDRGRERDGERPPRTRRLSGSRDRYPQETRPRRH